MTPRRTTDNTKALEAFLTAKTEIGMSAELCRAAIDSEWKGLTGVILSPGQNASDRLAAIEHSARRGQGLKVIDLWIALAELLEGDTGAVGKLWLGPACGKDMQRPLRLYTRKRVPPDIAHLPLLHLDATLRPELAKTVMPDLEIASVDAAAPHQHVRLISGSFGKSMICPDAGAPPDEQQRRANRLQECIDHVRWHAARHRGKRVLVITYKAIEAAFAAIPGVETAHYNAVAGLDRWKDIALLFLVGRLLPRSDNLAELVGALFDQSVEGAYGSAPVGVMMENGQSSSIRAIRHSDPVAEVLRAAICDDEVMQALGRGRGINRTAKDPLEVHIMADVVLPLSYERVQAWEAVRPDIVQQMLLAGLAVDSPADAARLHPGLFATAKSAEHHFARTGFNPQNPIRGIYREMGVKSASYRLGGKGRGWQTAYWIAGSAKIAKVQLEQAIGPLAAWEPLA